MGGPRHSDGMDNGLRATGISSRIWSTFTDARSRDTRSDPHACEPTDASSGIYCSIWDTVQPRRIVAIRDTGMHLFGELYEVYCCDEHGAGGRRGYVLSYQGSIPFCLAEVKSHADTMPPPYRRQWVLAIAFVERQQTVDETKPFRAYTPDTPEAQAFNTLDLEPVMWDKDYYNLFKTQLGILFDDPHFEWRWAETKVTR